MAEYINKLLLIKLIEDADCDVMADYGYEYGTEWGFSRDSIKNIIRNYPPADVAPVKHGKWLNFYNDFSVAECSECAECFEVSPDQDPEKEFFEAFKEFYNYCPNCGAKMDLED